MCIIYSQSEYWESRPVTWMWNNIYTMFKHWSYPFMRYDAFDSDTNVTINSHTCHENFKSGNAHTQGLSHKSVAKWYKSVNFQNIKNPKYTFFIRISVNTYIEICMKMTSLLWRHVYIEQSVSAALCPLVLFTSDSADSEPTGVRSVATPAIIIPQWLPPFWDSEEIAGWQKLASDTEL